MSEDRLVRVAGAQDQAEGELIQGILLDSGVQSVLRRSPAFDAPDFLAGGPRDILVAESEARLAREVLNEPEPEPSGPPSPVVESPLRVIAGTLFAVALVALATFVGVELVM